MRCWNCGHRVSKKARVCGHCEADLSEVPSAEEEVAVMELLENAEDMHYIAADDEQGPIRRKSRKARGSFARSVAILGPPFCCLQPIIGESSGQSQAGWIRGDGSEDRP